MSHQIPHNTQPAASKSPIFTNWLAWKKYYNANHQRVASNFPIEQFQVLEDIFNKGDVPLDAETLKLLAAARQADEKRIGNHVTNDSGVDKSTFGGSPGGNPPTHADLQRKPAPSYHSQTPLEGNVSATLSSPFSGRPYTPGGNGTGLNPRLGGEPVQAHYPQVAAGYGNQTYRSTGGTFLPAFPHNPANTVQPRLENPGHTTRIFPIEDSFHPGLTPANPAGLQNPAAAALDIRSAGWEEHKARVALMHTQKGIPQPKSTGLHIGEYSHAVDGNSSGFTVGQLCQFPKPPENHKPLFLNQYPNPVYVHGEYRITHDGQAYMACSTKVTNGSKITWTFAGWYLESAVRDYHSPKKQSGYLA